MGACTQSCTCLEDRGPSEAVYGNRKVGGRLLRRYLALEGVWHACAIVVVCPFCWEETWFKYPLVKSSGKVKQLVITCWFFSLMAIN